MLMKMKRKFFAGVFLVNIYTFKNRVNYLFVVSVQFNSLAITKMSLMFKNVRLVLRVFFVQVDRIVSY
jgi:hypothetical protein